MSRLKIWDLATGNWQYAGSVDPVALANDPAFRNAIASNPALIASLQASLFPAGTILSTAAAAADLGWILLTGQTIANANTLYPSLWGRIPTGWKSGTSLLVPDMRGRTIVGAGTGAGLTARTLGTPVSNDESHTITPNEIPLKGHAHGHSIGVSNHVSIDHVHYASGGTLSTGTESADHSHGPAPGHSYFVSAESGPSSPDTRLASPGTLALYASYWTNTAGRSAAHTHTVDAGYTGYMSGHNANVVLGHSVTGAVTNAVDGANGTPINVMQPSYVLNWQMKVH